MIHSGCVQSWKRLISVMPWVTSGMMTTALIRYPTGRGIPRHISSALARMTASMAKKMKVKDA